MQNHFGVDNIRNRALKALRAATAGEAGSGSPDAVLLALWVLLLGTAAYFILVPGVATAWESTAVFVALPIVTVTAVWRIVRLARNSAKGKLRSVFKKNRK